MNTRLCVQSDSSTNQEAETSSVLLTATSARNDLAANSLRERSLSSCLRRSAMKISRARWFIFLRRVFHYQNGSRSDLGSNPLNSRTWIVLEFIALLVQVTAISFTLAFSGKERPIWTVKLWICGYDVGCLLNLMLVYGRYRHFHGNQDASVLRDLEQQALSEDSRCSHLMNKCKTSLDLFFAIWFMIGNIWIFDSRFGSFRLAPRLHFLWISLLAWNALCYSFPFILFLLLCCVVPLISTFLGYNMNMGYSDRGACDDQISTLPSWRFKQVDSWDSCSVLASIDPECCICLAKYKEKEEVRQLPCSHMFHLKCVDQWLRIISCCPLCKQELER